MLSPILLEYLTLSSIAFLLLMMIRVIFMRQRNTFKDRMLAQGVNKSFYTDTKSLAASDMLVLIPCMRWIYVTFNVLLHISLRSDTFQDVMIKYYANKNQK